VSYEKENEMKKTLLEDIAESTKSLVTFMMGYFAIIAVIVGIAYISSFLGNVLYSAALCFFLIFGLVIAIDVWVKRS